MHSTKNSISICFLSPDPPTPLNIINYGTTNLYLDVSRKHFYEIILFGGTKILCLQKIQSSFIEEALGEWHICQNSVSVTCVGLDRCQNIEYSRLSNGTYTDLSSFSNFFVTASTSGTQRSNFINIFFTMDESVEGIQENMILNWFLDK